MTPVSLGKKPLPDTETELPTAPEVELRLIFGDDTLKATSGTNTAIVLTP